MKGSGSVYSGKRRWNGLVVGVLCLVFLSMLVPLVFLLGLHNGFQSSVNHYDTLSSESVQKQNVIRDRSIDSQQEDHARHVEHIVEDMMATNLQDLSTIANVTANENIDNDPSSNLTTAENTDNNPSSNTTIAENIDNDPSSNTTTAENINSDQSSRSNEEQKGSPSSHLVLQPPPADTNDAGINTHQLRKDRRGLVDENMNLCEVRFGSYCLWSEKNKEKMNDSMVKKLKDALFVARAYYPSVAKLPAQNKLSGEMRLNIQDFERILSESSTDTDLPPKIETKLRKMEAIIVRAKSCTVDCNNVDKKLRQILDMTEDEANFHMKHSIFLYQVAIQTMPKGLHCLSMNLTVEYFKSSLEDMELSAGKFLDPSLQHYAIFSKNVLPSSVVINSTVMNAKESGNLVFHVLTDRQNYFAMKQWFFKHKYKDAAVQVLNIEHHNMDDSQVNTEEIKMALPLEFRFSFSNLNSQPTTEYMTTFSHSHFLLPEIFKSLNKMVVLGDDVVVQQDLSALWNLNMGGKVNGAVQICPLRLGLLNNFLSEDNVDEKSCVWMSGLNLIDLVRWRELDLTQTYLKYIQRMKTRVKSAEAGELAANLLTFQGQIYALNIWALSGLGHDYKIDSQDISRTAVLHYNGNMKPWLELGISEYKPYWMQYLNQKDDYLTACNVNVNANSSSST